MFFDLLPSDFILGPSDRKSESDYEITETLETSLETALSLKSVESPCISLATSALLNGCLTWVPGLDFSTNEAYLFHAFVNGFMNAVSPQFCHPQLTPVAIFVPQGIERPLMKNIFAACGAAFLSCKLPDLHAIARRKYAVCLEGFASTLTTCKDETQEWMAAAALLFCLRDKVFGCQLYQPAAHLTQALHILRKLRKKKDTNAVVVKFMIESFLFNYSNVLLSCDSAVVKRLPSPFEVFDEWRAVFEHIPFSCSVPWMNNPVFGAASGAFELSAKVSWLSFHFPLNGDHMITACELLVATYKLKLPEALEEMWAGRSASEFKHLKESLLVAELLVSSCQLLLAKLMNPDLEQADNLVQTKVSAICKRLRDLSPTSQEWVIMGWPMLVTGTAAILPEHRNMILELCLRSYELFHTAFMKQLAEFLVMAWGTEAEPGPGWNALFDRSSLLTVCV